MEYYRVTPINAEPSKLCPLPFVQIWFLWKSKHKQDTVSTLLLECWGTSKAILAEEEAGSVLQTQSQLIVWSISQTCMISYRMWASGNTEAVVARKSGILISLGSIQVSENEILFSCVRCVIIRCVMHSFSLSADVFDYSRIRSTETLLDVMNERCH